MRTDVPSDEERLRDELVQVDPGADGPDAVGRGQVAQALLDDGRTVSLREAGVADIDTLLGVIRGAFLARPQLGERAEALTETQASLAAKLAAGSAYLAEVEGDPAGCVMVIPDARGARLGRVSVLPAFRRLGIATFVVGVLVETLALDGVGLIHLLCRKELTANQRWWTSRGFVRVGEEGNCWVMERDLPVVAEVPDAEAMQDLGRRVATLVRAGDLIIASGDLGAGKTTFAQGLGAGMGVTGQVTSPTFVLSRVHASASGGPALVHVDAYRLGGTPELEDLDLDASISDSVTLVEWGTGVAESLSADRLEIDIRRGVDPADETRWVFLTPIGARWRRADLEPLVAGAPEGEK